LKQYASKEMLKSAEMWTATFDYKEKKYGIMGDGEMTSSGHYLLAEVENEKKAINPKRFSKKSFKYEVYSKGNRWQLAYKNEKGVVEYTRDYSTQKEDAQKAANDKNKRIANEDFKEEYFQMDKSIDIYEDYVDEHYQRKEGERYFDYQYRLKEEEPKKDSKLKKLFEDIEEKGKEYSSEIIYRDAYDYFSNSLVGEGGYLQIEDPSVIYNFGEYTPGEIEEFLSYIWEDDDDKQEEELDKLIKKEVDNALEDLGYEYLGRADVLKSEGYEVDNYGDMFYSDVYKKVKDDEEE